MPPDTARASPSIASSTSNGTSQKRKRAGADGVKYYAVREGRRPGVYHTWEECLTQIKGHKGALFKSFASLPDAQAFASGKNLTDKTGESKFYAVQIGKTPGVYTDWPSASAQIAGVKRPKHRRFDTRAAAEAFVAEGKKGAAAAAVEAAKHVDKKLKLVDGAAAPAGLILGGYQKDAQGNIYDPGTAPLPPDAEDGFDPNIKLDANGNLVHKTEAEKTAKKLIPKLFTPPGMLTIYTDGSSLRNGTAGARAGVGVYFGPGDSKNVSEALTGTRQTNQRAELTAILRALEIAPRHRDVTIYTDSRYAIDCVTNWYKNWRKNGWVTAVKKPVENRDLVQDVRAKMEEREGLGRSTSLVWVKGHNGDRGNVEADRLAVEGARQVRGAVTATNKAVVVAEEGRALAAAVGKEEGAPFEFGDQGGDQEEEEDEEDDGEDDKDGDGDEDEDEDDDDDGDMAAFSGLNYVL